MKSIRIPRKHDKSGAKDALIFICGLLAEAALAEWIILLRSNIPPAPLGAFLICFSLVLGTFVALTSPDLVARLREWAASSRLAAAALPLLLLLPYLILALGTGTWSWKGSGKLVAYIEIPVLLLMPDRMDKAIRVGWRDFAAMTALALPVGTNWLTGIWTWPEDVYFFRPLYSVCIGVYAFCVIRNLSGVGYRLTFRRQDLSCGLVNLVGFSVLGIPLGLLLHFIHPHEPSATLFSLISQCLGIYIMVAIPEELLFRGILQNFLVRALPQRHGLFGVLIASVLFGLAHLHHRPVPNWRYAIMATLAGLFYGNAFRLAGSTSASGLTHSLVDTVWHFWF
jgi:uncharacterized protein